MAGSEEDFVTRLGEISREYWDKEEHSTTVACMVATFLSLRGVPESDYKALSSAVRVVTDEAIEKQINSVDYKIRSEFKGETIYIKKQCLGTPHAEAIAAEYTGKNMAEIRERYGVSRSTVYRCVKN